MDRGIYLVRIQTNNTRVLGEYILTHFSDITNAYADINVTVWSKSSKNPNGKMVGQLEFPVATIKSRQVMEKTSPLMDSNFRNLTPEISYKANYASCNVCGMISTRFSFANYSQRKVGYDDFMMMNYLGSGSYGKVMLVKKKDTNQLYAAKVVHAI